MLIAGALSLAAGTTTVDFEPFAANTAITDEIPGMTFSHATILVQNAGLSYYYPPHSGTRVVYDAGGAMGVAISFSPPVIGISGYFTHYTHITMRAFDATNQLVATAASSAANNTLGNSFGAGPNELLCVAYAGGIARVTITGNPGGGSFTLDDLTLTQAAAVPLLNAPEMAALGALIAAAGVAMLRPTSTPRTSSLPSG